jgi:eukaryotic-like serine/threonine-protein kinase
VPWRGFASRGDERVDGRWSSGVWQWSVMVDRDWSRVKDLFHSALERQPSERAAYLHASCGDETGVRAEVERLLAAHEHAGGFIEQSPVTSAGRVLGHYELERLVGVGGMGEVYRARDLELGRTVAIKIALGHDADAHARLRREAQHASQLNHPNISTIYEVGTSDGHPFIVMELVEGQRLSDLVPSGGLPAALVSQYGMQIADALAHAHRHGVTHRDLKSANVVVTPEGRAKVLDFGLARRIPAEKIKDLSESQQVITAEGMMAGTLSSMAPEVFRGVTADARSDIWALGVVLYEMATGKPPFAGATGFLLSGAILYEPPAPLPDSLPQSIRNIITRCLEKDPNVRYENAGVVRVALEDATVEAVPSVSPQPVAIRPSVFVRRWQYGVAWLLAILLAYGSYRMLRSDEAPVAVGASGRPAIAVMNFENAGGQDAQWLSQGIPRMLLTGLAQMRGVDIVSTQRLREAAEQHGVKDLDSIEENVAADVAKQAGAGAIVIGSIYKADAEIRIDARVEDLASGRILVAQSVRGTDIFALVDELASRIRDGVGLPADPTIRRVSDVSTSSVDAFRLYAKGVEAFVGGRGKDALEALEESVRIDPAFAEAYLQLGAAAAMTGQPRLRREYLRKAAEHANRLSDPRRLQLNATLARDAGDVREAARIVEELITKFPETEAAYTVALHVFGGELRDTDKLVHLMKIGASALPTSSSVRNNYGYALLEAGRYADGIREFQKFVELLPREANPYDSLADGHLASGSAEKAVEFYSRALATDPGFSGSRFGLSWSLAVMGRYDEALATKSPLKSEEGFLVSRLGGYNAAEQLLITGRQQAEGAQSPADQSVCLSISAALALERRDYARALRELAAAEKAMNADVGVRQARHRVLIHMLSGLAELGTGRSDAARARLAAMRQLYRPVVEEENFWFHTLEGEIALADGQLDGASAAFSAGEPTRRKPMTWQSGNLTILANSLPFRDGAARVAIARGDLRGAIQGYRRLLTYDATSKFIGAFEPRYVLQLARLLEKTGDKAGALNEYERFLQFWKNADANLPELAEARRAVARLRATG